MGCHIFSTPIRGVNLYLPTSVTSYGPGAVYGNWPIDAKIKLVFPGHVADCRQHARLLVVRRRDAAAAERRGRRRRHRAGIGRGDHRDRRRHPAAAHRPADTAPCQHVRLAHRTDAGGTQPLPRVPRCRPQGPGTTCSAGFDYAQLVTEAVLLGSVAEHFPNETLVYDPAAMRVTSQAAANKWLQRSFRKKYLLTRL